MAFVDENGDRQAIAKVRYSHDAMIDVLVARPMVSQREVARHFGFTEGWVSQVFASDAFKKRFAERRDMLVDPLITANLTQLFEGLGRQSISVLQENLEVNPNADVALKALEIVRKGLSMGAADKQPLVQNFVAVVPPKSDNYEAWAAAYSPAPPPGGSSTIEGTPTEKVVEGE